MTDITCAAEIKCFSFLRFTSATVFTEVHSYLKLTAWKSVFLVSPGEFLTNLRFSAFWNIQYYTWNVHTTQAVHTSLLMASNSRFYIMLYRHISYEKQSVAGDILAKLI